MKRMMLWCVLSMACGPQDALNDAQGSDEASLGALPPVVNCAARTTQASCEAVSVACEWRAVPCPLAASSGGGPITCTPFACVSKDPGPIGCGSGTIGPNGSTGGTSSSGACGGGSGGGPATGGPTSPGAPPR